MNEPELSPEEIEIRNKQRREEAKRARKALPCRRRCWVTTIFYFGYCCAWIRFFISWMCWACGHYCCKPKENPLLEELEAIKTTMYKETNKAIARELFRQGHQSLSQELKLCMRRGKMERAFGFEYAEIPQPCTIFVARHDKMSRPTVGKFIADSISHAKLVEFPHSSHIMFVRAEITAEIVNTLISTIPTRLADDFQDISNGGEDAGEEEKLNARNDLAVAGFSHGSVRDAPNGKARRVAL